MHRGSTGFKAGYPLIYAALTLAIIVLVTIPSAITTQAAAQTAEADRIPPVPITLQLRWHHQFQFAGYYAAKAQGFYRNAGLDVSIVAGAPDRQPLVEVLAGRAQFGTANSELLFEKLNGTPLVALASIFQHSASVLLVRRDSRISSPQDLVGRKVMSIGKEADIGLMAMLRNEGVDPDQVIFQESSYDIDDLVQGNTDAFNSYLTNEPYILKKAGVPVIVINPATYGTDFYSDILFTSADLVRNHPDRVKRFRAASLRGWIYAMQNQEEIVDLILNKYKSGKTREHLQFEASAMVPLILPDLIEMGHMNPGRWKHMADTFVMHGFADPDYSLEGFIYDPDPPPDLRKWYGLVGGLIFAVLVVAGVAVVVVNYNRKLKIEIGERALAEAALRESEARLSRAAEMAKIGYWVWDEIEHKAIYCSEEMARIYGVDSGAELAAMTSTHTADLAWVHPEDKKRFSEAIRSAKETKLGFEIEHKIINSKGEIRNLHVIEEPITDEHGRHIRSSGITQDITELKRVEEDIRKLNAELEQRVEERTEELQTAQAGLLRQERLATLGQLAATVSHELRNPLGVIRTSSYIAREGLSDAAPRVQRSLERIERSAIRCERIINELLDFTRITRIESEPTAVDAWLDETLDEQIVPSGVSLRRDFGLGDMTVPLDHDRFRRVIINIFDNACQAMIGDTRTSAGFEKHTLTVRTREYDGRIEIIFEDTGPGIPPDVYENIFEPLFSTKGFGVGLGLPVVKQIMEQHGGGIKIESEEGRETRVCLWLPANHSAH